MAVVLGGNQVKLDDGRTVTAQRGGWYDGQQFWEGSLAQPGQLHPQSDQQGAGQAVSQEVIAQTDPKNVPYINQRRQQAGLAPSPTASAPAQPYAPGGASAQTPSGPTGEGITGLPDAAVQPTLNLPDLYKNLQESSGVGKLEQELSDKEKQFIEATGQINDNPFLSEGTRVGRVAKLDKLFQERTANLRGDIATKKADVETQLNLELKQLDIQSDQTRLAWDQFNTLLSSGALQNASGDDIANITRSTGISSTMIRSAIKANKKDPEINSQLIQTDDGTSIRATLINKDTGEIISSTVISGSKPRAAKATTEGEKTSYYQNLLREDAGTGMNLNDVFKLYTGILDPDDIYALYNANSIFGTAKESPEQLSKYGVNVKDFSGL